MTQQELQDRQSKKELQIQKIEKRIEKLNNSKTEIDFVKHHADSYSENPARIKTIPELIDARNTYWGGRETYEESKSFIERMYQEYLQYCDREIRCAERELQTAKEQLEKIKQSIAKENAFQNEEKIKVIWDFLLKWKEDAREFFIENGKHYYELQQNKENAYEEWIEKQNLSEDDKEDRQKMRMYRRMFEERYYSSITRITKDFYWYAGKMDEARLDKFLEKDIKAKYHNLIAQITEKAGNIIDAAGLTIGPKGDINGYVVGDRNIVHVETITAGGYNIQRLHYRTLVNIVNK